MTDDVRVKIINNKMTVQLHKDEADSFMAKAIAKSNKYEKIMEGRVSPYGQNHAHSHFVGMVSEHAANILMQGIEELLNVNLNIDPAYQDETRDGECDLIVNGLRIEVKCIKHGSWARFGPCISAAQRKNIERKADVVLWALYNERKQTFTFEGYNMVKDISGIPSIMTGPEGRKVENHPVLSIIKPLHEMQLC